MATDTSWSRIEVEAIVADYLHMLVLEYSGQAYNKAAHRRTLLSKLNGRTEGAIELKHQNISAVLHSLGFHWIPGYKPRGHYQALLHTVVEEQLASNKLVDEAAQNAAASPAAVPLLDDFHNVLVEPPKLVTETREPSPTTYYSSNPKKRDYLEREARNISLGMAGEEFVLDFERFRLSELGQNKLSKEIRHVSKEDGDGLGYDILSFEPDGRQRYIEVKTTAFAKETPFFISRGEIQFAKDHEEQFHLYRLYEFRKSPKLFELAGSVEKHCAVNPISYICEFS
ncbi:MAG: DUF3883 domain-containing protein [Pseudomonadota bacterium]